MQNEILGDLQQNLPLLQRKQKNIHSEEHPLEEFGAALATGFSGNLGKHSTGLVSRLIGGKMPGGFNALAIKSYLVKTWGMGPMRSDAVLLLATTLEPPKRLSSEAEARTWLDNVVSLYSQRAGIQLLSGVAAGSSGGSSAGVINSEEFQADQSKFAAQQIEVYMRYLGNDFRAGNLAFDQGGVTSHLQARLGNITHEYGDACDSIQPHFDSLKAITPVISITQGKIPSNVTKAPSYNLDFQHIVHVLITTSSRKTVDYQSIFTKSATEVYLSPLFPYVEAPLVESSAGSSFLPFTSIPKSVVKSMVWSFHVFHHVETVFLM